MKVMKKVPAEEVGWEDECNYSNEELESFVEKEAPFYFQQWEDLIDDELDQVAVCKEYYLKEGKVGCLIRLSVNMKTDNTKPGKWRVQKRSVYECGRCLKFQRKGRGDKLGSAVLKHAIVCKGDLDRREKRRKLQHTMKAVNEGSDSDDVEASDSGSDSDNDTDSECEEDMEEKVEEKKEEPTKVAKTFVSVRSVCINL